MISGLAFSLKIPFVIPIAFGLLGSPVWIVPASCGIITYYMTDYVKVSAAALKEADASGIAANLMSFTKQVLASKEMWLMVMAVTIGILVVNLSVQEVWIILGNCVGSGSGSNGCCFSGR